MRSAFYSIEGPWPGKLAIAPRPRGGDWLDDEIIALQTAGVHVVVSLLVGSEISELELDKEHDLCEAHGMKFIAYPVADRGVPPSLAATRDLVNELEKRLKDGQSVILHCRQGVGRSALLAACLIVLAGIDVERAFQQIATGRGCAVPDTIEQKEWVTRFARTLLTSVSS